MAEPTKADLQAKIDRLNATPKTIYEAMTAVARDLGPVMKERIDAGGHSYQAFSIDTVFDAIRPLFARHGIVMVPQEPGITYVERDRVNQQGKVYGVTVDARVRAEYVFYGPDGSSIRAGFATEARDTGDKATIQALQQCVKYVLVQSFQIAAGDPTAETPPENAIPADASPDEQVKQYVTDAKRHVAKLMEGDVEEAAKAWPVVLEKAGIDEIRTLDDRVTVMVAADELYTEGTSQKGPAFPAADDDAIDKETGTDG